VPKAGNIPQSTAICSRPRSPSGKADDLRLCALVAAAILTNLPKKAWEGIAPDLLWCWGQAGPCHACADWFRGPSGPLFAPLW